MAGQFPDGHFPSGQFPDGHFPSSGAVVLPAYINPGRLAVLRPRRYTIMLGVTRNLDGTPRSEVYVSPKRSTEAVPIGIDLHDAVILRRSAGMYAVVGQKFRPPRADATGFQYRCTVEGYANSFPFNRIAWPRTIGGVVQDGSTTWIAEAIADDTLIAAISAVTWPTIQGLTFSNVSASDLRYQVRVAGGESGLDYEIAPRVTLEGGDILEGLIVLPVRD